ncbi:hypothetical protein HER32_15420 [Hymenobacter sp. BT18]|uniref:hypothetical protein n=1 Tax=Hymenobacter sp. BT18 TaxID=2835648 RepID=UPI00143E6A04|nr:hypothetical protein [Hymenobacter sp. BT18]QIX62494.1 hypothetical protein HER32_15420 [Hymenobacter sp. BT18]
MEPLIGIGFWRSLLEPELPDPAWFIDAQWPQHERQMVLDYLLQGKPLCYWMGYSWCRFRCGTAAASMGAADLTDGTYCWPEGLAHYVHRHLVRLPESFVQYVLGQASFPTAATTAVPESCPVDMTWWQQQAGWNPKACSFPAETDEQAQRTIRAFEREMVLEPSMLTHAACKARTHLIKQWRAKNS